MHQTFEFIRCLDGRRQHERVLFEYPDDVDLEYILHRLGLKHALSDDRQKKYGNAEVTYDELFNRLTPEMMKPYNVKMIWPDRETRQVSGKPLITRCELDWHREAMEREEERTRRAGNVAERYAKTLVNLKDSGNQYIAQCPSPWVAEKAVRWAFQFIRSGETDSLSFLDEKLASFLSPQSIDENGEPIF